MKFKYTFLCLAAILIFLPELLHAQMRMANLDEARSIATNWVAMITHEYGSWGDAAEAAVTECQLLTSENRSVGFVCEVEPVGYVLVSLIKGLAPVKAYSETSDFCVSSDEGLDGLLKRRMGNLVRATEARFQARDQVQARSGKTKDEPIFEVDYMDQWDRLMIEPQVFEQQLSAVPRPLANYAEGEVLLQTNNWSQGDPYNRHCPTPGEMESTCTADHCAVGCVALSAAQIMHYYSWPPYGADFPYDDPYQWTYMPNAIDGTSPAHEINAVANLCREVGAAVDMNYCHDGCGSGAYATDMEDAFENHFRYHPDGWRTDRSDYQYGWDWYNAIRGQINLNMPIQYWIVEEIAHTFVCDGWRIFLDMRQYHMNLGWAGGQPAGTQCWEDIDNTNMWYTMDTLPCIEHDQDYMLVHIVPAVALFDVVSGTIPKDPSFRYRYFNVDCFGNNATFEPGQWLQFLPGIVVTGNTGSYLSIQSTAAIGSESLLFSRGDLSKGVSLTGAELILYDGGAVTLH